MRTKMMEKNKGNKLLLVYFKSHMEKVVLEKWEVGIIKLDPERVVENID